MDECGRFLMVCLVLNGREMVHQLVSPLKIVIDECKWTFQEGDFKKWELVVQKIVRFLKVYTTFMKHHIWEYQNNFYNFTFAFKILIFKTRFFSNNFQNSNFSNLIFKTSHFK